MEEITIEDFKKAPPAILDFTYDYPEFTVNIFHKFGLIDTHWNGLKKC